VREASKDGAENQAAWPLLALAPCDKCGLIFSSVAAFFGYFFSLQKKSIRVRAEPDYPRANYIKM